MGGALFIVLPVSARRIDLTVALKQRPGSLQFFAKRGFASSLDALGMNWSGCMSKVRIASNPYFSVLCPAEVCSGRECTVELSARSMKAIIILPLSEFAHERCGCALAIGNPLLLPSPGPSSRIHRKSERLLDRRPQPRSSACCRALAFAFKIESMIPFEDRSAVFASGARFSASAGLSAAAARAPRLSKRTRGLSVCR